MAYIIIRKIIKGEHLYILQLLVIIKKFVAFYYQKELFLKDKNGLSPADAATNPELKLYLLDFMTQPFSNPIYKAKVKQFLLEREKKIEKRNHDLEEEKMKNNNKKILNINKDNSNE